MLWQWACRPTPEITAKTAAPPSPLLAVPNVTAHPSTASVPITVLLYDGPLLCDFTVAIKELSGLTDACRGRFYLSAVAHSDVVLGADREDVLRFWFQVLDHQLIYTTSSSNIISTMM